jgi:rhodanese-related sulfurtransferase
MPTPIQTTPAPTSPAIELPFTSYLPEVPRISVEEVKAKLDNGSKIVVIDSRSNASYEQSRIAGAILLPLGNMAEPYSDLQGYDEIAFY